MSSGPVLGPANALISLSRPLDHEKGRIQAAPVSSLSHGKLRKRHEVVVAVDGEAVTIYDVSIVSVSDYFLRNWAFSLNLFNRFCQYLITAADY